MDYSKSRYENAIAERAYEVILDGDSDGAIYDGDMLAFDRVYVGEDINGQYVGTVILRYDSQGFIWTEYVGGISDAEVARHWAMLAEEYGNRSTEEEWDD